MARGFRDIGEITAAGIVVGGVVLSAYRWPDYAVGIWAVFVVAVAMYLYGQLRKPVNYRSMAISGNAIDYAGLSNRHHVIRLDDIVKLEFVGEQALFPDLTAGYYLETKWMIRTRDSTNVEIMDEWPHRRQLLRTFENQLIGFDAAAARKALKAKGEGRWLCFQGH